MELTKAAQDVLAERKRQVEKEGWTPEHDEQHGGALAEAAAAYALSGAFWNRHGKKRVKPFCWPWDDLWWKPTNARRDMVKAAALLHAAIEAYDRTEAALTAKKEG